MVETITPRSEDSNIHYFLLLEIAAARALAGVSIGSYQAGQPEPDVNLSKFAYQRSEQLHLHQVSDGEVLLFGTIVVLVKFLAEDEIKHKDIRDLMMERGTEPVDPTTTAHHLAEAIPVPGLDQLYPRWVVKRAERLQARILARNDTYSQSSDTSLARLVPLILKNIEAERWATKADPDEPIRFVVLQS